MFKLFALCLIVGALACQRDTGRKPNPRDSFDIYELETYIQGKCQWKRGNHVNDIEEGTGTQVVTCREDGAVPSHEEIECDPLTKNWKPNPDTIKCTEYCLKVSYAPTKPNAPQLDTIFDKVEKGQFVKLKCNDGVSLNKRVANTNSDLELNVMVKCEKKDGVLRFTTGGQIADDYYDCRNFCAGTVKRLPFLESRTSDEAGRSIDGLDATATRDRVKEGEKVVIECGGTLKHIGNTAHPGGKTKAKFTCGANLEYTYDGGQTAAAVDLGDVDRGSADSFDDIFKQCVA